MQNYEKILNLIKVLSQENNYLKALRCSKKIYNIDENELKSLTPTFVLQHFKRLQTENNEATVCIDETQPVPSSVVEQNWCPNEFKLFSWVVVCYFYTIDKQIGSFDSSDLAFINSFFSKKSSLFIEFYLVSLLKQGRSKKDNWCEQEINLLRQIIKQEKYEGKWSEISFALFCRSEKKYFRTSHKCREKWFNYLNPVVSHEKWTIEEDCDLFKYADIYGSRWAKISKAMNGVRTEHMVKNRFNSLTKLFRSRFQRCSMRKMIENISKFLQSKLENHKQDPQPQKINEQTAVKIQVSSEDYQQQKNNKVESNSSSQKPMESQSESSQQECEYNDEYGGKVNEKPQEMQGLMAQKQIVDWQQAIGKANVTSLIDYASMDFQYKKTIFSGSVQ